MQAKCALVIKPLGPKLTPIGTFTKSYVDSSDFTSDEDFDFIEKQL